MSHERIGLLAAPQPERFSPFADASWRFRPDVEGLRAIAILLVIAYHSHLPFASGGFIGVDVFFVLSGFLITGILLDEVRRTGRVSLVRFWARRARRLLPAVALVAAVTLLAMGLYASPYERIAHARSALAVAFYVSNVWFARRHADYFADDVTGDPFLHTWSLSVEEQFYLVFAPLVAVIAFATVKGGFERFRSNTLVTVALLAALSLAACLVVVRLAPVHAFYQLPPRAWQFGAGALLALLPAAVRSRMVPIHGALAFLGLAGLIASAMLMNETVRHPGIVTVAPVLCTVLIVLTGAAGRTVVSRFLTLAPMRAIGRLSYSWYLWHWPALVLLTAAIGPMSVAHRLLVCIASLGPAAVAYRLVERPVRESRWLGLRPKLSIAGGVTLGLMVAAIAGTVLSAANVAVRSPDFSLVRTATAQPRIYSDGCHADWEQTEAGACVYGARDGDTLVVLFGDSHAAQWFPALDRVAQRRGWRLVPLTKSACPSVTVTVRIEAQRRRYDECDAWRESALQWIARENATIVVVSNRPLYRLERDDERRLVPYDSVAREWWRSGLSATIDAVQRSGAQAIVLQDTPYPGLDVLTCLARSYRSPERCALTRSEVMDTAIASLERTVTSESPPAAYVSMSRQFCDAMECPAVIRGTAVFRDHSHITVAYAESLSVPLDAALRRVETFERGSSVKRR